MRISKRTIEVKNFNDFNGVAYIVQGIQKKDGKPVSFIMRKDEFKEVFNK